MTARGKKPVKIRQAFAEDLEREFALIRSVIARYPVVSLDTEFPGTIFKPNKEYIQVQLADPSFNYDLMKANVDALHIIQLGLSLSDPRGNLPDFGTPNCYVWEFNFRDFDLKKDNYNPKSIQLLKEQGIDFVKNREMGIDSRDFAIEIMRSGLVYNNSFLTWITYHGAYDFGYMMKIMTQQKLPDNIDAFMAHLAYIFGYRIYDLKHTFKFLGIHGGLEKVAKVLKIARAAGASHQAGSDSLLTLQCFAEVMQSTESKQVWRAFALYGLSRVEV